MKRKLLWTSAFIVAAMILLPDPALAPPTTTPNEPSCGILCTLEVLAKSVDSGTGVLVKPGGKGELVILTDTINLLEFDFLFARADSQEGTEVVFVKEIDPTFSFGLAAISETVFPEMVMKIFEDPSSTMPILTITLNNVVINNYKIEGRFEDGAMRYVERVTLSPAAFVFAPG